MIPLHTLVDLALGQLDPEAEAAAETHLLECDGCASALSRLLALQQEIAGLAARGALRAFVTSGTLARLEEAGVVTRRYLLAPGATVPCTVGPEDLAVLAELKVELRGVHRLDLWIGPERMADIPFEPNSDSVKLLHSAEGLRTLPSAPLPLRLVSVGEDGVEQTVGEYVLDHTAPAT